MRDDGYNLYAARPASYPTIQAAVAAWAPTPYLTALYLRSYMHTYTRSCDEHLFSFLLSGD